MKRVEIDINCDMGESYGRFTIGNDALLFPYITSCNIACGFHGGDPLHIEHTLKKALEHDVRIGAHPSYPDLMGFGRRKITMGKAELKAIIKYQIAALKGMTESLGGQLRYVKPHGALYNEAVRSEAEALTVIEAVREIDPGLALMGLAGSRLENLAVQCGMDFIPEAFADRRYASDGGLVPRSEENPVITDPDMAVKQAMDIILHQKADTLYGETISVKARSICIHGDNEAALIILKTLNQHLEKNHISKRKFIAL